MSVKELTQAVLTAENPKDHTEKLTNAFNFILQSDKIEINSNIKEFITLYAIGSLNPTYRTLLNDVASEQQINKIIFENHDDAENDFQKGIRSIPGGIRLILNRLFNSLDNTPKYEHPESYLKQVEAKKTEIQELKKSYKNNIIDARDHSIQLQKIDKELDIIRSIEHKNIQDNQTPSEVFLGYISGQRFYTESNNEAKLTQKQQKANIKSHKP